MIPVSRSATDPPLTQRERLEVALRAYGQVCAELGKATAEEDTARVNALKWQAAKLFARTLRLVPKFPEGAGPPAAHANSQWMTAAH